MVRICPPAMMRSGDQGLNTKITPKVFVFAMFEKEATHWLSDDSAIKFTRKISMPGLSRGYGNIYLTQDGDVCFLTVGTALINAALSIAVLTASDRFNLSKTYFLLTGIAGANPRRTTIGAVAIAKFAIQVDTQLEFDGREVPSTWGSGYVPFGAQSPTTLPALFHGSEVYELNENLRLAALAFAREATLQDSDAAAEYRARYATSPDGMYHAATLKPTVMAGDVLSSNTFWHGYHLSEAMDRVAGVYTTGQAEYAMTAQEDTAILTGLLRAALQQRVDFSRIILTRSGSNFDRAPSNDEVHALPFVMDKGGLQPALQNVYLAGVKIVQGIVGEWTERFEGGISAKNYVGDVFGSLGGVPDFLGNKKATLVGFPMV